MTSVPMDKAGETLGGVIGTWVGRVIGGAIGELIGPEGIPIGAAIGGKVGQWAGQAVGKAAGAYLASQMSAANEKVEEKTKAAETTDACSTCPKDKDPCAHLRKGNGPGKYRGGAHGETKGPTGDGLDSHHMPAKQGYPESAYDDLPAIQMDPADHRNTQSYGGRGKQWREDQRQLMDQGKYGEALQNEIDDARRVAREAGDPNKYDQAIKEMQAYAECRKKHGLPHTPQDFKSPAPANPSSPSTGPPGPPATS